MHNTALHCMELQMTKLLGAKDVATLLGVSLRKLEQMVEQGDLPAHVKFGRTRRWRADQIQRWLDAAFEKAEAVASNR